MIQTLLALIVGQVWLITNAAYNEWRDEYEETTGTHPRTALSYLRAYLYHGSHHHTNVV